MKNTQNKSPIASQILLERAKNVEIPAELIPDSKPRQRRTHSLGSTFAPQKVITLNGIRMSLGQAKEYIAAREKNIEREKMKALSSICA